MNRSLTAGLFVNPGHRGDAAPQAAGWGSRNNRSFEYDSLGDAYARFLIEELIPFTVERYDLHLTDDRRLRAICGMGSGGICSFTAAWERPDYFGKVLSHVGIQMFDATGRLGGVISKPQEKATVSCAFGGDRSRFLYVCSSDKVFRRPTLTHGPTSSR